MNREQIKKILFLGTLAPSAHNTQPWKFDFDQSSISLFRDKERALDYSDSRGWETTLSLGACLTNLIKASEALGVFSGLDLFPDGEKSDFVAKIHLKENGSGVNDKLLETIYSRQTNRSNYAKKEVPGKIVEKWENIANNLSVSLKPIDDVPNIKIVAELHSEATKSVFSDQKFRDELSTWVRNSMTKRNDGMPGYSTNIPLPMSFLGSWMIKNFDIGLMQSFQEKSALLSSPLIIILSSKGTNEKSVLNVGRVFEEIALDATVNGLVYAPLGACIEVPEVSKKLRELINTEETPLVLFRAGYSKKQYKRAPKRSVEEVSISAFH